MNNLILNLNADWQGLDERVEGITDQIEAISKSEENCHRLMSIPSIGPILSTAVVAAIGTFGRGRGFGALLGLDPRQFSTGGKTILGRISKRGSKYLHTLFIQAAHVIIMRRKTGKNSASGRVLLKQQSGFTETCWLQL